MYTGHYIFQALQSTKHHVVDDCFTEMLSHWIKRSTPPPTWTALRDALNSPVIDRGDVAGKVQDIIGRVYDIIVNKTLWLILYVYYKYIPY